MEITICETAGGYVADVQDDEGNVIHETQEYVTPQAAEEAARWWEERYTIAKIG